MPHNCRKESRAAANKADEVSLELQRVQGENEAALQATQDLGKQNDTLHVSGVSDVALDLPVGLSSVDLVPSAV